MKRFACVALVTVTASLAWAGEPAGVHWPGFRGPLASGVAEGFALPTSWDVEKGENIRWRTPIAGLGHSCPAIWGDRVFLTTAVSEASQELRVGLYGDIAPVDETRPFEWKLLCLDKKTGKVLWERVCHKGVPRVKRHPKGSHANCTPATDGRYVAAFFGPEGLHCYDLSGQHLWSKDLGELDAGFHAVPAAQWGFGSSPIIHEGRVIVQCDVQKDSFIAAFDAGDGRELWRTARAEAPTWCTPTLYFPEAAGGTNGAAPAAQIVVGGWRHIGAYDFSTGKEIWKMAGTGGIPVPTPIADRDLLFFTANHRPTPFVAAVRANARGEIALPTDDRKHEAVAWADAGFGAYMQTPIVYRGVLYVCRDNGVLAAYDARTGKQHFRERLGDGRTGFTASPVAGDGKLYYTSEQGDVFILNAARDFEPITSGQIGQTCMATPAVSEGVLYFRTEKELIAIGGPN
ncbi:MAG: PQQ-like beta-propeller repeat protein [Phycisphaerae bacterium]|nr:PQQ-binding-like beta-propeller repeat protein [Phycisphaerae bacterium]MCZ2399698.1 PQQ-like beta-propeller repeat protein [Phycisphaerae bacterium]